MERDEMIERGARALYADDHLPGTPPWERSDHQDFFRRKAAAVVDAITPDDEEQVGWLHDAGRMFVSGIKALPEEQPRPEGWEPVYVKRTPPVAPPELLCAPGAPCSARCDRCCPPGYCTNCGKTMGKHGPLANCYPLPTSQAEPDIQWGHDQDCAERPITVTPRADETPTLVSPEGSPAPSVCPTCWSDDKAVRHYTERGEWPNVGEHQCPDPWHQGADR